jgi:hypothetical protein
MFRSGVDLRVVEPDGKQRHVALAAAVVSPGHGRAVAAPGDAMGRARIHLDVRQSRRQRGHVAYAVGVVVSKGDRRAVAAQRHGVIPAGRHVGVAQSARQRRRAALVPGVVPESHDRAVDAQRRRVISARRHFVVAVLIQGAVERLRAPTDDVNLCGGRARECEHCGAARERRQHELTSRGDDPSRSDRFDAAHDLPPPGARAHAGYGNSETRGRVELCDPCFGERYGRMVNATASVSPVPAIAAGSRYQN